MTKAPTVMPRLGLSSRILWAGGRREHLEVPTVGLHASMQGQAVAIGCATMDPFFRAMATTRTPAVRMPTT